MKKPWFYPDGRPKHLSYAKASGTRPQGVSVKYLGSDTMFPLVRNYEEQYQRAVDKLIEWRGGTTPEMREKLLAAWPQFCAHYGLVLIPRTIYTLEQRV